MITPPLHWAGTAGNDIFRYHHKADFYATDRTAAGNGGFDTLQVDFNAKLADADFIGLSRLTILDLEGSGAQSVKLGAHAAISFGGTIDLVAPHASSLKIDSLGFSGNLRIEAPVITSLNAAGNVYLDTTEAGLAGASLLHVKNGSFVIHLADPSAVTDNDLAHTKGLSELDMAGGSITLGAHATAFTHVATIVADTALDAQGHRSFAALAIDAENATRSLSAKVGEGSTVSVGHGNNSVSLGHDETSAAHTTIFQYDDTSRADVLSVGGVVIGGNQHYEFDLSGTGITSMAELLTHAQHDRYGTNFIFYVDQRHPEFIHLDGVSLADATGSQFTWVFH